MGREFVNLAPEFWPISAGFPDAIITIARPVVRLSVEDFMPIGSSSLGRVVIASGLLFASLCSREVSMSHAQSAPSPEQTTRAAINRFNEAFNRHDADALAETLTEDTVFEDTSPVPRRPSHRRQSRGRRFLARMVRAQRRRPLRDGRSDH